MHMKHTDLNFVCSRIPKDLRNLMMKDYPMLMIGGGFIRATIAGEKPSDIDIFGPNKEVLKAAAMALALKRGARLHESDNAFTILAPPRIPAQFIYRWVFDHPAALIGTFDFTICQAALYIKECPLENSESTVRKWDSVISEDFYRDLAARRLVYTHPLRNEDAGGSLMRVRKFLTRGYNIQAQSLAGVCARLFMGVRNLEDFSDEKRLTKILSGLLREVDPLIVVDGVDWIDEHQAVQEAEQA